MAGGEDSKEPQLITKPPFIASSWVAIAYVRGDYNPPSRDKTQNDKSDFLGLYVSKEDPGYGLLTFNYAGEYVAFHRCGEADATVAYAMIHGLLHYEIPLEQWYIYPTRANEVEQLNKLGMKEIYDDALKGLCSVLHQARFTIRSGRPKLEPMFLLAERTAEEISNDEITSQAMWCGLVGEEKAKRRFENIAKLKARMSVIPPEQE